MLDMSVELASSPLEATPFTEIVENHDRAFAMFASNLARSLSYLVVTSEPARGFRVSDIYNRQDKLQGQHPGLQVDVLYRNMIREICLESLAPDGLIIDVTEEEPDSILTYKANLLNRLPHMARVGAILDWELQYPEYRASDLIGVSRRTSQTMATNSLTVYEALLDSATNNASLTTVQKQTGLAKDDAHRTLNNLVRFGTVQKASQFNLADRTLQLIPGQSPVSKMSAPTKAIYETVADLTRLHGPIQMNGQELVRHVRKQHPDVDEEAISYILTDRPLRCAIYEDREQFGRYRTAYRLAPAPRPAIADLILRRRRLREDPEFVKAAAGRAAEILGNPDAVAFLMAKAASRRGEWHFKLGSIDPKAHTRWRLGSLTLTSFNEKWRDQALCRNEDPEIFFPIGEEGPSASVIDRAKALCLGCPVMDDCLQWSLDTGQQFGVSGGMTPRERRHFKRVRVMAKRSVRSPITNNELSSLLEGES
jgi:WhiB family transcriptional regulator, redox-sensing transcriptional regulator